MPAAVGRRHPARCSHSEYSHSKYSYVSIGTSKCTERDAGILQVATGRQLLEEGDALLHGLRCHGVLTRTSLECT